MIWTGSTDPSTRLVTQELTLIYALGSPIEAAPLRRPAVQIITPPITPLRPKAPPA